MSKLKPTRTSSALTAIERLRELLDERGIEYYDHATGGGWRFWVDWSESIGDYTKSVGVDEDDTCYAILDYLTPGQAIAATLGRGTCHITREPGSDRLWYCDRCKSYHEHPSDYAWEFCPRCGAKAVKE